MTTYIKQTADGQPWQHCYTLTMDSPLEGTPVFTFHEETVIKFGETILKQPITACRAVIEPGKRIPILDPITGQSSGQTATHEEIYKYVYSLYIQTATDRDNTSQGIIE